MPVHPVITKLVGSIFYSCVKDNQFNFEDSPIDISSHVLNIKLLIVCADNNETFI